MARAGIMGIDRDIVGEAQVPLGNRRNRGAGYRSALELHHLVAIDGMGDGTAYQEIVKRGLRDIERIGR